MITNIEYIFLITFLLIFGGWVWKALISLSQGRPVSFNLLNPLNLKARWPKVNKEEIEK